MSCDKKLTTKLWQHTSITLSLGIVAAPYALGFTLLVAATFTQSLCVCLAGWTAHIEVQASVVTLRNVAHADDFGLLNPILHRYMNGACSLKVRHETLVLSGMFAQVPRVGYAECFRQHVQ